jgi:hypothetical protein
MMDKIPNVTKSAPHNRHEKRLAINCFVVIPQPAVVGISFFCRKNNVTSGIAVSGNKPSQAGLRNVLRNWPAFADILPAPLPPLSFCL